MTEQDGIPLPWHPESEKPDLPFVICTNGEGDYWAAHYDKQFKIHHSTTFDYEECWIVNKPPDSGLSCNFKPLAWIEPEKFTPFVKED